MRVLLSWLREFCPVELEAEQLADVLTMKGAKVEALTRPWEGLEGVVVARVLEVRDHPRSKKLCIARVDSGSVERELVVGVRNMVEGDLVALAAPGARVPILPEPLSAREIRGIRSDGMLCSARELGISADHAAILVLPADLRVGADVKSALGLDDVVLDIEVTPNRPDFLSVLGVAREAAAATGVPLRVHRPILEEVEERAEDAATVDILDLERCPRYLARLISGVTVGPSPIQAQARLFASGMRPLSNVVDATNYALLERGHPLHPFDLDLLHGQGIVVRLAESGERLVTLDDVERVLEDEDLVIGDRARAVAIAGVMGSAVAEVSESTRDVLLESAYFERVGILRTARRLRLSTEASTRFERGADPEAVPTSADRAAELVVAWSGGSVLGGAAEAGKDPDRRRLRVRPERAAWLIGYPVTLAEAKGVFDRLGMESVATEGALEVEIPGYRVDLDREVDLVEEIVRVQGYDRLESELPGIRQPGAVPDSFAFRRRIREILVRTGLREIQSYSFASRQDLELAVDGEAVMVANPLAADDAFLRVSLIPGLLRAMGRNIAHGVRGALLFEVGTVFRKADPVEETERVAWVMAGPASPGFGGEREPLDFFSAKGAVEALFDGLSIARWTLEGETKSFLHPARSTSVAVSGKRAGFLGELHPAVAARLDLPPRTAVAELDVAALRSGAEATVDYREVPRFPPVHRDLAFVVDPATPAGAVREEILSAAGGVADSVVLFDLFTGGSIPEGRKSLAFSVDFRAPDRTLTDEEADEAVGRIVERLAARFGAELRTG
jgi:phenylalanyl-tRNA synthetase beta chain